MKVTYNGVESFRIQFSDIVVGINPVSKDSKLKSTRFGANIALITTDHPDFNGFANLKNSDKNPFIISGPGEYEVGGAIIKGFPSSSEYGGSKISTIYKITLEDINILFLGPISSKEVAPSFKEEMFEGVDILFVPIYGDEILTPSEAYKLSVEIAPKITIPMHYGETGGKDALDKFLKEQGSENLKPIEKLTVKPKDLENRESGIVVL